MLVARIAKPIDVEGCRTREAATRDHAVDQEILEKLASAASGLAYLGVVGSRAKLLRFRKRLENKGVPAEFIASIRGPVDA